MYPIGSPIFPTTIEKRPSAGSWARNCASGLSRSSEQANACSCRIKYENSTISSGYSGRTVLAECVQFEPHMFTDGNLSVVAMNEKTARSGNILDDAVDKILAGMIDIEALWRLI